MAITKEEFKEAFRTVMARDYADIPPKDEIDWTPSPEHIEKMEALIEIVKKS